MLPTLLTWLNDADAALVGVAVLGLVVMWVGKRVRRLDVVTKFGMLHS